MLTAPEENGRSSELSEGRAKPSTRRAFRGLKLHHVLIVAFSIVAALPIGVLALWESHTSFQLEVDSVRERHLLVARNLTSTMSRYVKDLKATFNLALESDSLSTPALGLVDLLISLELRHVLILGPDNKPVAWVRGLENSSGPPDLPEDLAELRALAATDPGHSVISPLHHDAANEPVFYLVKSLPGNRLGLGIVSTNYLVSLQKMIAFGAKGHAVIVDGKGQVIAHPLKDWVAASRDISGVPVVAAMMRGESGVGTFYSPAFGGDMIAGYAVVPETGWGVMVPQPIAELRRRASEVTTRAAVVAGLTFIAVIGIGWLFALYLSRPVRQVATIAEAVLGGNEEVSVPTFRGLVPQEIRRLGAAFNTMLSGLRRKAIETNRALRQAETSNQAKTQFLANMSHEIRTPLNEVVGMIELMQVSELSSPQRRYLETAIRSSNTLLRIVDDILDLSKIEAGKLELDRAPFHLPTLVHDVRSLLADQARIKNLTLTAWVPDSLNIVVLGDAHRLLQILSNLVGNAVKFTASGSVAIRVALDQERGPEMRLRFEVSDTGIGIPLDKQALIFEAFSQSDSSMTRRYGGTGLGLSIARQLCHMMGGQIGVHSDVGIGSTFWFTVYVQRSNGLVASPVQPPFQPPFQPPVEPSLPVTPLAGAPSVLPSVATPAGRAFQSALRSMGREAVSILVVDDNAANLRVTQALLETLGCQVTLASNGLEAVATYRDRAFDLVLMDCQMPEMDGYEAARLIRQIEAFGQRRTPIVALTAHAMPGSREASLDAGMDDQLTKPLTVSALTDKLLFWLGRPSTSSQTAAAGPTAG